MQPVLLPYKCFYISTPSVESLAFVKCMCSMLMSAELQPTVTSHHAGTDSHFKEILQDLLIKSALNFQKFLILT